MKEIRNYDDLVERLTVILVNLIKDCRPYDTDIYLYYDEERKTATLDTFANPGGTSWINDSGFVIHTDKQHYETPFDDYPNIGDLANVIDGVDLVILTAKNLQIPEEEVEWGDVKNYIENDNDLCSKFYEIRNQMIEDECTEGCREKAKEILYNFMLWYDEEYKTEICIG